MTENDINLMLDDLYAAEPSLKRHDDSIRKLVASLLAMRPDIKPDPAFAARLKQEVLASLPQKIEKKNYSLIEKFMDMRIANKVFLPVGAALTLLLAAVLVSLQGPIGPRQSGQVATNRQGGVVALSSGAFGTLGQQQTSGVESSRSFSPGFGGGSGAPAPGVKLSESAAGDAVAGTSIAYPGDYVQYKFVYNGEPLTLSDANLDVFRRVKNPSGTSASSTLLSYAGGLVNLATFPNMNLQYFTVAQDVEFGYESTVDLREGTVSVNANYLKWPHPEQQCQDEACYLQYRLAPADVPSDAALISIARDFLIEHDISVADLGEPEVRNDWRLYAERTADLSQVYVPESVAVIFPQRLNGTTVYDEGGYAHGIAVNVNIRHNRVDGVWNLTTRDYQSSSYAAETDATRILAVAEQGGVYGGYSDPNARTVELQLSTPTRVLLRTYQYKPFAYTSDELYVPALLFPVSQPADGQPFYRQNIIVPLVKDLLNVQQPIFVKPLPAETAPAPATR